MRNRHSKYEITYPAPGHPELAERIAALLEASGIPTRLDPQRGSDHGAFIPLKLMYPEADIPTTLQLPLLRGLDPAVRLTSAHSLAGAWIRRMTPSRNG